ncbi:hypothetical protein [Ohtaekwangia koreensis]|uniref:Glycosyl transferase family 2 n=1 Tax=Ohtaekwangia koreensis TaxID=688867 RepID=A0A1T5LMS5_9BACT|nr:hypothetical protein [Ohtaekwangia koreensis]SKC77224.1 hypothetical protein SAMN05660236_3540 [Ohtaekwangia koreensis]
MTATPIIKVGFCVSYDWELLKKSVPRIYADADIICLAIDKDRKSWTGNPYAFNDQEFYDFISTIDVDKKIIVYEDCFSLPELNARQNCNRHRMLIAEKMGKGGWHIQVDSDEYFLDFNSFVKELKKINPNPTGKEKPLNVCACWVPLIKKTATGYLHVIFHNGIPETVPMATTFPDYQRARHNDHFNVITRHYVIHETWARSENELWFKINNWGHAAEELSEKQRRLSYYNLWKSLDENNYQYISNFHPASPTTWPALNFCIGQSVEEFIRNFVNQKFPLSTFQLLLKNSRNVSRVKFYTGKLLSIINTSQK